DHHFETEKKMTSELHNDIQKMTSELRYEIDKVTAGQRLDLNLEKESTRDELANQTALSHKVDRNIQFGLKHCNGIFIFQEVHALKAQLEGAKYDVVKYCIGSLVS
ncbi:hypothetical protein Lal_00002060, partial [Lupinus albus]